MWVGSVKEEVAELGKKRRRRVFFVWATGGQILKESSGKG
jgi:hypothetical protein